MVEWTSPDPIDQMTPSLIWDVCGCCVGHSPPGPCGSFVAITRDGSLCFFGSSHDEPSHAESANGCPRIWRPKATKVTWEPHVSIFRRMWWSTSTLTEALRLYSGLLVGDHKHGDLVAEEPKASSIFNLKSILRTDW